MSSIFCEKDGIIKLQYQYHSAERTDHMKTIAAVITAIISAVLGLLAGLELIRLLTAPKNRYISVD